LARETNWGYARILGELRKLGIKSVSRNSVKNILVSKGFNPGPQRGVGTWDEFIKIHATTLWQCDFFSLRAVTPKGMLDPFVLVFLHVDTRRVILSPATQHPDEAWVCEQAQAFVKQVRKAGTVIGVSSKSKEIWFDVKPTGKGFTERYWPQFVGGPDGFDKKMIGTIGELNVGDKIKLGWSYDEQKRATQAQVTSKAMPADSETKRRRSKSPNRSDYVTIRNVALCFHLGRWNFTNQQSPFPQPTGNFPLLGTDPNPGSPAYFSW